MVGVFVITPWQVSWFLSNQKILHNINYSIFRPIFKRFLQVVYPVCVPINQTFNFWKSLITLLFFTHSLQNWTVSVPLYVLTALQIWRKSARVCTSYCTFSKVCKKKKIKKKDMKNIRRTLKVCISVMARRMQLKFGMECVLLLRTFHSKNSAVSVRWYWVTDAWIRHFLGSCIIHTCLSRSHTGCTWPHVTLLCVLILKKNSEFSTRAGTISRSIKKGLKQAGVAHNTKPQQNTNNCYIPKCYTIKQMHSRVLFVNFLANNNIDWLWTHAFCITRFCAP